MLRITSTVVIELLQYPSRIELFPVWVRGHSPWTWGIVLGAISIIIHRMGYRLVRDGCKWTESIESARVLDKLSRMSADAKQRLRVGTSSPGEVAAK